MMILITGQNNSSISRTAGFTLLELLLVMLLIAIAMGIAAPCLGLFRSSRPILNTAATIVSLTDYARSQSISEGHLYKLNIDKQKGIFWLTSMEKGIFERLGKDIGRDFVLPEGVEIESVEVVYSYQETTVPGLRLTGQWYVSDKQENAEEESISFSPEGYIQPAVVHIRDKKGNQLDIICSSPLDHFHIEQVKRNP